MIHYHWRYHGKFHRANGPAYYLTGTNTINEEWWCHGELHRDPSADGSVGPAVTHWNGTKEWWYRDTLHRGPSADGTVGPAIIRPDGSEEWYHHGKFIKKCQTMNG